VRARLAAALWVALPLGLAAVSLPHTFTNGTIADADQVNANFDALATAIDGLSAGGSLTKASFSDTLAPGASMSTTLATTPSQLFVNAWASSDGTTFQSVPMVPTGTGNYGFGNGQDGAATLSGVFDQPRTALASTASSGADTIALSAAVGIDAGDLVLLLQSRGGNTGSYAVHRVISRNGTTLTLDRAVDGTFVVGGSAVATAQRLPEYTDVTVSGTLTAPAWDGGDGGVVAFYASGIVDVSGTISADGAGWRGGVASSSNADYVFNGQGESEAGDGSFRLSTSGAANGTGGGAGCGQSAGGGGAHVTAGVNGTQQGCYQACPSGTQSRAGAAAGAGSALLRFGGGGGASGSHNGQNRNGAAGGAGGGAIFIVGNTIDVSGIVSANGADGVDGYRASTQPIGGGGGGAGGTIRLVGDNVALGVGGVAAVGGIGGINASQQSCSPSGVGGNGGDGLVVTVGNTTGSATPAAVAGADDTTNIAASGVLVRVSGTTVTATNLLPDETMLRVDLAY
jgi:hypothetical protein